MNPPPLSMPTWAVLFDLDGVLTDTAELHYKSWQTVADAIGVPFDRRANEALRGLSREESLARVLGPRFEQYRADERQAISDRKNAEYLRRVERMSPSDLLPGAAELLRALRAARAPTALASSSRNAHVVLDRLGIRGMLDAVIDGVAAPRSKPDPQVFLLAAAALGVPASACVVVEDAEAGVAGARAAGMSVVGVGPAERVGAADLVVASLRELDVDRLAALVAVPRDRVRR